MFASISFAIEWCEVALRRRIGDWTVSRLPRAAACLAMDSALRRRADPAESEWAAQARLDHWPAAPMRSGEDRLTQGRDQSAAEPSAPMKGAGRIPAGAIRIWTNRPTAWRPCREISCEPMLTPSSDDAEQA